MLYILVHVKSNVFDNRCVNEEYFMTIFLPDFTSDGVLPARDYELTLDELADSMLVTGRPRVTDPEWDSEWRLQLVENLRIMTGHLWSIGRTEIYVDGSFVENKNRPGDIDGYFECSFGSLVTGELESELNAAANGTIWTWDDRVLFEGKLRLPMWMRYRIELYPHTVDAPAGCGIFDAHGNELEFPAAFRQSREFAPKGIVKIVG